MFDMDAEPVERSEPPATAVDQDQLWRAHSGPLMRFATVLVGPSDAHDIVVDAFLRASERIVAGDVDNPRAYLLRSVANTAAGERRSRQRRWARDLRALSAGDGHDALPDVDVRRAVADLSVAQRAVVYLAYWEDLPERAIATTLGVSHGTVRRHVTRARAHLRKALR